MAIQILLVDDEAVDLEWLRRRVLASGLPVEVAGTANSGFAALKLLEEQPVDVILSDIRMPIMSGTEFARQAKALRPDIKIVFISGHEDFGYAQEAIAVSALGYLLKPVEDQDLFQMLNKLCTQIEQEREQNRSMTEVLSLVQEELLLRWLEDAAPKSVSGHLAKVLEPILEDGTAVAVLEIDNLERRLKGLGEEARRDELQAISELVRTLAAEARLGTVVPVRHSQFLVLGSLPPETFALELDRLTRTVAERSSYTLTAGLGSQAADASSLHASYRQAQTALSTKWLLGNNRVIRDTAQAPVQAGMGTRIHEAAERLLVAITDYDLVTIDDVLEELFRKDTSLAGRTHVYELIVRLTSSLHANLQQRNENLYELLEWESHQPDMLFEFETLDDILSWLRRRFFELSELLYIKRQRQKRKGIEDIMQFVEARLEQKLTLKEVASHFHFTPNYLGTLFKDETGTNFSDYLNTRKTERVCELLLDPGLKIYEIAERMGYKNIIYFNRQFKQSMGMTPGEYRKKHNV
ncbi:response regulator [Paenibacillus sp. CN-4]|uniref:response regulator n=1 Tax=Paenibacillus nanchangensis TaxID=3348343 RepID=UPI00397CCA80